MNNTSIYIYMYIYYWMSIRLGHINKNISIVFYYNIIKKCHIELNESITSISTN